MSDLDMDFQSHKKMENGQLLINKETGVHEDKNALHNCHWQLSHMP